MGDPAEAMPLCLHCGDVIRGIGSCPAVVMSLVRVACTCLMRHAPCAAIVVAVAVAVAAVVAASFSIGILYNVRAELSSTAWYKDGCAMHWGCRRLLEDKRGQEAQAAAERRHQRRLRQDAYAWRWKRRCFKPALARAAPPSSPLNSGVDDGLAPAQTLRTHPWMNGCRMLLASMLLVVFLLHPSFAPAPMSISNTACC